MEEIKKNEETPEEMQEILTVPSLCYNYGLQDTFALEECEYRRIYLNETITDSVIDNVVYHIIRYNRQDKDIEIKDRTPIVIYINTNGGEYHAAFALIDAITMSKTPVYTVNLGSCASMGFLIFLAGEKRFAMPHSVLLMHDGKTGAFDSAAKMFDIIEFERDQLYKMEREYVSARTKINPVLFDQNYRKEWYMLPTEAKKHGVVDFIIGEDCNIDDIL